MNRRRQRSLSAGLAHLLVLACLALAFIFSGCSILASREAAVGCQLADIGSTAYALRSNPNAYETNPLGANQNLLYALKLGLAWFIWQWDGWQDSPESMRAVVTVLGCAPVPGNLRLARER